MNLGGYSKFIVAALGAVTTALTTFYGTAHWVTVVSTVLSALVVYLVPNVSVSKPPVVPPAP
jgi:hypothetical protein